MSIRAGHDADAGVELRLQLERLTLGRLRGQPLLEQLALGFFMTALLLLLDALALPPLD